MKIDNEMIRHVANLAKLDLTDAEREKAKQDMENILAYMDSMNELDTDGISPMTHPFPQTNVFREDVVTNDPDRDSLLANAPAAKDGCFAVPKTVE